MIPGESAASVCLFIVGVCQMEIVLLTLVQTVKVQ